MKKNLNLKKWWDTPAELKYHQEIQRKFKEFCIKEGGLHHSVGDLIILINFMTEVEGWDFTKIGHVAMPKRYRKRRFPKSKYIMFDSKGWFYL